MTSIIKVANHFLPKVAIPFNRPLEGLIGIGAGIAGKKVLDFLVKVDVARFGAKLKMKDIYSLL